MRAARWIATVVAVAVTLLVVLFFYAGHQSERVSARTAEEEFQRLRAHFEGQRPLLDMRERRAQTAEHSEQTGTRLRWFHTVIFDTRSGERLIRIKFPYLLGSLFGRRGEFQWLGQLTFLDDTEFDPEQIQLSLDQVARRGPGLLVDYRRPSGGQFIAWVD